MAPRHRLTVRSLDPDPRAGALTTAAAQLGLALERPQDVDVADVYFLEGDLDEADRDRLHELLVDPLLQEGTWDLPRTAGIEVTLLPGVYRVVPLPEGVVKEQVDGIVTPLESFYLESIVTDVDDQTQL